MMMYERDEIYTLFSLDFGLCVKMNLWFECDDEFYI